MGMAVEFSPERTCEQRGAEPGLPGCGKVQSWGNNTFIWFCSRKQACGLSSLTFLLSVGCLLHPVLHHIFKFDKVCLVCLLIYRLWAVAGPAVEEGSHSKNSSEGLTWSLAAQDQVPSASCAQVGLRLQCKATEWIPVNLRWVVSHPMENIIHYSCLNLISPRGYQVKKKKKSLSVPFPVRYLSSLHFVW